MFKFAIRATGVPSRNVQGQEVREYYVADSLTIDVKL